MTDDDLIEVKVLGIPPALQARSNQHIDGLRREFALIRLHERDPGSAPHRLESMANEIEGKYDDFTAAQRAEMEVAIEAGTDRLDLTYHLPAELAEVCEDIDVLLDEADEYCRLGGLLTLASPPDLVSYRKWILGELTAQIRGAAPRSWEAYSAEHGVSTAAAD